MKAGRQIEWVVERLGRVNQVAAEATADGRRRAAWGIAAVAALGLVLQPACRVADSYLARPQPAMLRVSLAEAVPSALDPQVLPDTNALLAEAAAAESALVAAEASESAAPQDAPAAEAAEGAPPTEADAPQETEAAAPAQPAAPAEAAAPAAPPDLAPAAPLATTSGWRSPNVTRIAFDPEVERWRPLVREELAQAYADGWLIGGAAKLDEDVVLALIEQESGGDDQAYSWAGAIGLAQVMPFTYALMLYGDESLADSIGEEAMFDPRTNLRTGIRYLALALQDFGGNLYWSLSSYNAGIGAVEGWRALGLNSVPPVGGYVETADYAPAILSNLMAHRPGLAIPIPAPMTDDQVEDALSRLEAAGLW